MPFKWISLKCHLYHFLYLSTCTLKILHGQPGYDLFPASSQAYTPSAAPMGMTPLPSHLPSPSPVPVPTHPNWCQVLPWPSKAQELHSFPPVSSHLPGPAPGGYPGLFCSTKGRPGCGLDIAESRQEMQSYVFFMNLLNLALLISCTCSHPEELRFLICRLGTIPVKESLRFKWDASVNWLAWDCWW